MFYLPVSHLYVFFGECLLRSSAHFFFIGLFVLLILNIDISLSCGRLFATPWTVAYQASLSMGFSRQEYQSGLPFPSPGDLPDPGIEPMSPALQVDSLPPSHQGSPNYIIASLNLYNSPKEIKSLVPILQMFK